MREPIKVVVEVEESAVSVFSCHICDSPCTVIVPHSLLYSQKPPIACMFGRRKFEWEVVYDE